jgi:HNH endonuclease
METNSSGSTCQCGCGKTTNVDRRGTPRRFIHGHNSTRRSPGKGWIEQGYRFVSVNGKKRAEHRVLMERKLDRQLDRNEIVHHIDWDRFNNDAENLTVVSRSEHMRLHKKGQKPRRWTQAEEDRAAELSESGMIIQDVADAIGRPYSTTQRKLQQHRSHSSVG